MSWQGGFTGQLPQLFMTRGQHDQLERSFTDPYKRRIAALEEQIAELDADGAWPEYSDYLTEDVLDARQDSIFIFTWPDGAEEWGSDRIWYLTETEGQPDLTRHILPVPNGTKSAVLVYTARNNHIWFGTNEGNIVSLFDVYSVSINWDIVYNNQIIHLY